MSIDRMCYSKVISNTTVNGDVFSAYIKELCLFLRDEIKLERACLILDNARIHKRDIISSIVDQFNFEFKFLSPYSYMLNPIENAFSKIKSGIKSKIRLGESGSLSEMLLQETRNITAGDASGYFRYIARNITNFAAEIPYHHN